MHSFCNTPGVLCDPDSSEQDKLRWNMLFGKLGRRIKVSEMIEGDRVKSDLLSGIICLLASVAIVYFGFQAFETIEIDYDPKTGRQRLQMSKSRALAAPEPFTLEGN